MVVSTPCMVRRRCSASTFSIGDGRNGLSGMSFSWMRLTWKACRRRSRQGLHLRVGVVDAVDHGEFVSRAAPGLLDVLLDGLMQAQKGELFNAGHKLIARGLNRRVKRNGKRKLLRQFRKAAYARDDAAGRDREVTCADRESLGVVQHAKCLNGVVEICKGLTLAHEDDACNTLAEVTRNVEDLVDHLLRGERAGKTCKTRGAEGTAHGASSLRGDADSKLVAIGHADRLNRDTVGEFEQVLAGTILGDLLHKLGRDFESKGFGERLAQAGRQVGHLVKRTDVLLVNPTLKPLGAKRGLP